MGSYTGGHNARIPETKNIHEEPWGGGGGEE